MKRLLVGILILSGCTRAPLKDPKEAFRLSSPPNELIDSYSPESLQDAFRKTLAAYDKSTNIPQEFYFGKQIIPRDEYRAALFAASQKAHDINSFAEFIKENFDFYEVYGTDDGWGQVLTTGYFAPVIKGSLKKTVEFDQPIYQTPKDFVTIDMIAFADKHPQVDWLQTLAKERARKPILRGRIVSTPEGNRVLPYLERKDIDVLESESPLSGQKLELAWVKPIDAFYLQIQGSGIVEISPKRRFLVGYDKQNGYKWFPIGKALTHVIPIEQMSMQRVRQYLETLDRKQLRELLNRDPSYVFFRKIETAPVSYSGAEVTGHRSIATDSYLMPKGTLAFFDIDMPQFNDSRQLDPSGWERKPRFVFDVDTGGAIKGGGRVDLYMGEGPEFGQMAGVMKRQGRLWYLAPKPEFLKQLKAQTNL